MTIAKNATALLGARVYLPEGPYGTAGNLPQPSFAPGTVIEGELKAEFEFVLLPVSSTITLNQGDCIVYDNSGYGIQSLAGTGVHPFGAGVGSVFFGGRTGELNGIVPPGNIWSYTFSTPGVYGIWVQRSGYGLINCATVNAQTKPLNTTAVPGQLNAPASPLATSQGFGTGVLYTCPTTWTVTGTTTSGSATITGVSWTNNPGITKGQLITGTGIPTGAVVTDFQGSTISLSQTATSSNSAITITVQNGVTTGNVVNGSNVITGVTAIAGLYPNQTLTGTGVSSRIVSITGVSTGNYTITLAGNATATNSAVTLTGSVYVEAFLSWPTISAQN
jgi:hypothetical protein